MGSVAQSSPATPQGPLAGRVAVITGATRGIGRAIVDELTGLGARVFGVARSEDDLRALADELDIAYLAADIAKERECRKVIDNALEEVGSVDILVNKAGIGAAGEGRIWDQDPERWRQTMAVNLDAPFQGLRSLWG